MLHLYSLNNSPFSHQKQKWNSTDTALLALGPGIYAWMFYEGSRKNIVWYNSFSMKDYTEKVLGGMIPIERLIMLDNNESARRHIQYGFNYCGLDKDNLGKLLKKTSALAADDISLVINKLLKNNLLLDTQGVYKISPLGEYLSDEIKALFASREVLNKKIEQNDIHVAHHWYPNLKQVRRFREIMLNGTSLPVC